MKKTTKTTTETVATFTNEDIRKALLIFAGMPATCNAEVEILHEAMPAAMRTSKPSFCAKITWRKETETGDISPLATDAAPLYGWVPHNGDTPPLATGDAPLPGNPLPAPKGSGCCRIGNREYLYPDPLPAGWRWERGRQSGLFSAFNIGEFPGPPDL